MLLKKYDQLKKYEMENISVHTPSHGVQKLGQFVTHSIPWITAKLWCESHVNLLIWCSTFINLIWGRWNYDISEILAYGTTNTKSILSPWGYGARVRKVLATGENWWV